MVKRGQWVCTFSKYGGLEHRLQTRDEWRQHQRAEELRRSDEMMETQQTRPPSPKPSEAPSNLAAMREPPPKRHRKSPGCEPFFIDGGSIHSSQFGHTFKKPTSTRRPAKKNSDLKVLLRNPPAAPLSGLPPLPQPRDNMNTPAASHIPLEFRNGARLLQTPHEDKGHEYSTVPQDDEDSVTIQNSLRTNLDPLDSPPSGEIAAELTTEITDAEGDLDFPAIFQPSPPFAFHDDHGTIIDQLSRLDHTPIHTIPSNFQPGLIYPHQIEFQRAISPMFDSGDYPVFPPPPRSLSPNLWVNRYESAQHCYKSASPSITSRPSSPNSLAESDTSAIGGAIRKGYLDEDALEIYESLEYGADGTDAFWHDHAESQPHEPEDEQDNTSSNPGSPSHTPHIEDKRPLQNTEPTQPPLHS